MHPHSAAALGLYACHTCALVSQPHAANESAHCPRCGSVLHQRKPDSIGRTWALLITAFILIIPANMLPIMETGSLFGSQRDTIMSGVLYLWSSGSWALALLVFFASVVVPIAKLIALAYLLHSVQRQSPHKPQQRTKLYHWLKFIGRWSMLDIYVVTLLVALVQLQSLASIKAAPGAIAFGAVVVITMFASMTFDPRMIWDSTKDNND
jgi:paraquat-inducible protein A